MHSALFILVECARRILCGSFLKHIDLPEEEKELETLKWTSYAFAKYGLKLCAADDYPYTKIQGLHALTTMREHSDIVYSVMSLDETVVNFASSTYYYAPMQPNNSHGTFKSSIARFSLDEQLDLTACITEFKGLGVQLPHFKLSENMYGFGKGYTYRGAYTGATLMAFQTLCREKVYDGSASNEYEWSDYD